MPRRTAPLSTPTTKASHPVPRRQPGHALAMLGLLAGVTSALPVRAATIDDELVWGAWFNTATLSDRLSVISDLQVRSSDNADQVRNVLARAGLAWQLDDRHQIAAGYAHVITHPDSGDSLTEQRTWQQLSRRDTVASLPLTHRLRLEQRRIELASGDTTTSDRLRYMVRTTLPLSGPNYVALQNEVFLTLSGREALNDRVFDQNRAYAGLGRKFSPSVDAEVGYLNQWLQGRADDTRNHVLQVALITRW